MEIDLMSFWRRCWGHVDHFMSTSFATLVVSPGRKEAYPCRIWLSTPVVFARTCSTRTTWRYWKQIYKRLWTAWSLWYLRSKKLRDCLIDSSPDKLKLDRQIGNTRAKSILSSCNKNRELLYKFKESRLDAFMSKRHNVILLEYYLQK